MGRKTELQCLTKIFEQMSFVCRLHGLWGTLLGSCCIRITTIPANDFDRRVSIRARRQPKMHPNQAAHRVGDALCAMPNNQD
jgi:hypothetical protein